MKIIPPALFLIPSITLAAAEVAEAMPPDDDFSPAMFIAFLFICAVCLVLTSIGIVLAVALIAFTALLGAFGIVSSSALVALFRQRFSAGFRAFHYQVCAMMAAPCGVAAFWAGSSLFDFHFRYRYILVFGSLAGLVSGLGLAFAFDRFFRFVCRRITSSSESPSWLPNLR